MKTTFGMNIFGFRDKPFDTFVILLDIIFMPRQTCVEQFLFRNETVFQKEILIEQLDLYSV